MAKKVRIGDKLVEKGYITEDQLKWALSEQKNSGKRLGEFLVQEGLIDSNLLISVLKELLDIESVFLEGTEIDTLATKMVPENICKRYTVFPFKIDGNKICLAMSDPQDREAVQDVRRMSGKDVEIFISSAEDINKAIGHAYAHSEINKAMTEYNKNKTGGIRETVILEEDVNAAPIVRLVNNILENAVRMEASDIHIEQSENYMRVRFRIDGMLREYMRMNSAPYKAVISRIKIMSDINISEKRIPQDGRIYLKVDNKPIDFRVSTMPTNRDEKIAMRVLDKSNFMVSKEVLGIDEHGSKIYDELINTPYGLILVVGPTGSGKTTTLYSMLNQLNTENRNLLTIEDPIEYELPGVNQSQINEKAGLTFASGLRAFMRQDPDIIMVGEIRDTETAEIAIRASLTGHLVLSTLHANTAVGAISRLLDMDVESFLITSSLLGVISQRLTRKICEYCRVSYEADTGEKKALGIDINESVTIYKGQGCERCNNTGYKGRLGIFEMLEITPEIKELIDSSANQREILKLAKKQGMVSLKEDIVKKVLGGKTTVEEMIRIILMTD
ncbi:GspE/PulE family protein [Clostridioides sp. ZZV15-6597]|uniref:GspE/PulE family protein n=1 Tax=Clostridioides sp. ZZV15-6597 TaxID=2811500 RepID=UPI001D129604|nr:type II/IV secretion system protein [Clostridioides sp. ZZV15-6597]